MDKFLKVTQRISQRFQEHQMQQSEGFLVGNKGAGILG